MFACQVISLQELPQSARTRAADLYWQAFGAKLGRLLGPDRRAMQLLARVIRADHALVALSPEGEVIGVIGYRTRNGGFVVLDEPDMCAVYGALGGRLRHALIAWATQEVENKRFPIDGLAVAPEWRGRGVGALLLNALAEVARGMGYSALRLDVADENPRAKALYERLGFVEISRDRRPLLAPIFGMKGSTGMELRL